MSKFWIFFFLTFFSLPTLFGMTKEHFPYKDYDELWSEVLAYEKKGQYQSALNVVERIYTLASQDGNVPQRVKCFVYRFKYANFLDEDGLVTALQWAEGELETSPNTVQPFLYSILAENYNLFGQRYHPGIEQPHPVTGEDTLDVRLWSPEQFKNKVEAYYLRSLDFPALKEVDRTAYKAIITLGENVGHMRPSAYDVLLHRAIDYLEHGSYVRDALTDRSSQPSFTAILYNGIETRLDELQSLENDPACVDLKLRFLRAKNSERDPVSFRRELRGLMEEYNRSSVYSDLAYAYYSSILYGAESEHLDLVELEREINTVIDRFPNSYGAGQLRNLLTSNILAQELRFTHENVVPPGRKSKFLLTYRNISKAFVLVARVEPGATLHRSFLNDRFELRWDKLDLLPKGSYTLPGVEDHKTHTTEVKLDALDFGEYVLIVCENDKLGSSNHYAWSTFKVSNLAAVFRERNVFVLNRDLGNPESNVEVTLHYNGYNHDERRQVWHDVTLGHSDTSGLVNVDDQVNSSVVLQLKKGNDQVFLDDRRLYLHSRTRYSTQERQYSMMSAFSDRSIYRPGQRIGLKGVVTVNMDLEKHLITGEAGTVTLYDANSQVLGQKEVKTNEFGTFYTDFLLPENVLTGVFFIRSTFGGSELPLRVEEYKRPQILAEFLPVDQNYTVGDSIPIDLEVRTYFGSLIKDAQVQYRIVRSVQTPYFMFYNGFDQRCLPWYNLPEQEMAHGSVTSDERGRAQFVFHASANQYRYNHFVPHYQYRVEAKILAPSGEQVDLNKTITLSDRPYFIRGEGESAQQKDKVENPMVHVVNFDGQPTTARVQLVFVKKISPMDVPLKQRYWPMPERYLYSREDYNAWFPMDTYGDEDQIHNWKETVLFEQELTIDRSASLPVGPYISDGGIYQVRLEDADGQVVFSQWIKIWDANNDRLPVGLDPILLDALSPDGPGQMPFHILSGWEDHHFLIFDHHRDGFWSRGKGSITLREEDRNQAYIQWVVARHNRIYTGESYIPFLKDQKLNVEILSGWLEKVEPGQEVTWKVRVTDDEGRPKKSELFVTVFDESLNAYQLHSWNTSSLVFDRGMIPHIDALGFYMSGARVLSPDKVYHKVEQRIFPQLLTYVTGPIGFRNRRGNVNYLDGVMAGAAPESETMEESVSAKFDADADKVTIVDKTASPMSPVEAPIRENLAETAFFSTLLQTDKNGLATLSFPMSEALSSWQVNLMALSEKLRFSSKELHFKTSKPLLIQPFVGRFLRSGDQTELKARLSNLEAGDVLVTAKIDLFDALTDTTIAGWLLSGDGHTFLLEDNQTDIVSWTVQIPEDFEGLLGYQMTVKGGGISDGERGVIPVLPNKKRVTEAYSFFLRPNESVEKRFGELGFHYGESQAQVSYTFETVSQPLWYVFKTLPYQSQPDFEGVEQWMNAYFINRIGQYSLMTYPWLENVINTLENKSPLTRNEEVKQLLKKYTPYVRNALNEEEEYALFSQYYDREGLSTTLNQSRQKIADLQLSNGGYSWMPGGRDSWFVSQMVLDRWLELTQIVGGEHPPQGFEQLQQYCADRMEEYYQNYRKSTQAGQGAISSLALQYLFDKRFYDENATFSAHEAELWNLAKEHWLDYGWYHQAVIARLLLKTGDDPSLLQDIKKSFDERMIDGKDRGLFWKYDMGSRWSEQAVLIHSTLLRFYGEVGDRDKVPGLITWLIQNKRTQGWENKMSSVAAITALLRCNPDMNSTVNDVIIMVGGENVMSDAASTGGSEVTTKEGEAYAKDNLVVNNPNDHVAWANVYRMYDDQFEHITPFQHPNMGIFRQYYLKKENSRVIPLESLAQCAVGDRILVRLTFEVDRDMEYVVIRDGRAGGLEPGVQLSGYDWKLGVGVYRVTKDTETQFYLDYLPRGKHVLEYEMSVTHEGDYAEGLAEIQCLYAPEFRSHSAGGRLSVAK